MEDLRTISGRGVIVQFDFDRNGQRLLARAYQRLLAEANTPAVVGDSVQTCPLWTPTPSKLQEVQR